MKQYLICYDITNQKRLLKIRKLLFPIAIGGQKSALVVLLSKKELNKIIKKIKKLIKKEDKINIIEISSKTIYISNTLDIKFKDGVILI